jgi:N-acetylglutamate synthase-like GNAT family acetyltransferase
MPAPQPPGQGTRTIAIRPATMADQPTIKAMVQAERLNPLGLDWRRFIVAEDQGHIVGIGQIKPHGPLRELASIVVVPKRQHQGIGRQIVTALLAQETGAVYLMCEPRRESFYERFGFAPLQLDRMPGYFKLMYWLSIAYSLWLALRRGALHDFGAISIMHREPL